jgi:predicted aspartyl protease
MKLLKNILFLLFISYIFSSCVTKSVWQRDKKVDYTENIKQFLISDNKEKIFFLGEKYHFIFSNNKKTNKQNYDFTYTLISNKINNKNLIKIDTKNTKIIVLNSNNIKCNIVLSYNIKEATQQQIDYFTTQGFEKIKPTLMIKKFTLEGKIYRSTKKFTNYLQKIDCNYTFNIYTNYGEKPTKLEKIASTPLTFTTDIALTTAGIGAGVIVITQGNIQGFELIIDTVAIQVSNLIDLIEDNTQKTGEIRGRYGENILD